MEVRFQRIIEQLERKKDTHPHLAHLWQSYIKIKKQRFLQHCITCENIMERMTNEPDIDPNTISYSMVLGKYIWIDYKKYSQPIVED